jgi:two-component system chemotaxis response regulator CheY
MRVLIVEDDFFSRRVLQEILSKYGRCELAADGLEAVMAYSKSVLEGDPYTLICMDKSMPKLDGFEAAALIRCMERIGDRRLSEAARIFVITSSDAPKDVMAAFRRGGCDDYLVKPVSENALLEVLQKHGLSTPNTTTETCKE